jgi:hypothetical protein
MQEVADLDGGPFEFRMAHLHLLELGYQLVHHLRVNGIAMRAPEHRLLGRGHRNLKRGKLLSHLSMSHGSVSHPLR